MSTVNNPLSGSAYGIIGKRYPRHALLSAFVRINRTGYCTNFYLMSLLSQIVDRQAIYNQRPQELASVVILSKRVAFSNKYSTDPETGRHVRDDNGNITFEHHSYTVQTADGKLTSLLIREDKVVNVPPSGVIIGCKAFIRVVEGDIADKDYPKMNIKAGEHFTNVTTLTFSMDNAEWNARNGAKMN